MSQLFLDTSPKSGDPIPVLWRKINQLFSERNGGVRPPEPNDWKYNSIFKVLQILSGV